MSFPSSKRRRSRIFKGLFDDGRRLGVILGQADGTDDVVEGRHVFGDAVEIALAQGLCLVANGRHGLFDFFIRFFPMVRLATISTKAADT